MLRTALGPSVKQLLEDPTVVEVMLNPNGRLWVDRLSEGLADTGERLSPADGGRIARLVAHHVGVEVHPLSPRVSAELPESGERFEGRCRSSSRRLPSLSATELSPTSASPTTSPRTSCPRTRRRSFVRP